jgi:hypothetical protein
MTTMKGLDTFAVLHESRRRPGRPHPEVHSGAIPGIITDPG